MTSSTASRKEITGCEARRTDQQYVIHTFGHVSAGVSLFIVLQLTTQENTFFVVRPLRVPHNTNQFSFFFLIFVIFWLFGYVLFIYFYFFYQYYIFFSCSGMFRNVPNVFLFLSTSLSIFP